MRVAFIKVFKIAEFFKEIYFSAGHHLRHGAKSPACIALESYFASQDTNDRQEGLLLFPDTGIYYEFIPEGQWHDLTPEAIPLKAVEIGKPYAMVITTNGGLWRYKIGDTVMFTSTDPYRLCITGRTKQYINTFGEEVMVDNTDRAIELTSRALRAMVSDYTVAPVHMTLNG